MAQNAAVIIRFITKPGVLPAESGMFYDTVGEMLEREFEYVGDLDIEVEEREEPSC